MNPLYHHHEIVEVTKKGKRIKGTIRLRSYGWDIRKIPPTYGVLPDGQWSLGTMIMATEDQVRRV